MWLFGSIRWCYVNLGSLDLKSQWQSVVELHASAVGRRERDHPGSLVFFKAVFLIIIDILILGGYYIELFSINYNLVTKWFKKFNEQKLVQEFLILKLLQKEQSDKYFLSLYWNTHTCRTQNDTTSLISEGKEIMCVPTSWWIIE